MTGLIRFGVASAVLSFSVPIFAATLPTRPTSAVLKLKERVSIAELAREVQDPYSPRFGQHLTPEQIRELAGPSQADYDSLLADLRKEGFAIVAESPTHLWLSVSGAPERFTASFRARLTPTADGRLKALDLATVPSRLSLIESVDGLDTTRKSHPHLRRSAHLLPKPKGVAPATIRHAYGFDSLYAAGINGAGQHIAVATYDGFNLNDVRAYYSANGISPAPKVDQVQFNGTATYDEGSAGETQLDAELSGMVAPGARIHVFTSAANSDAGELQMFTAILDDNRAKVVNYSWGGCEQQVTAKHKTEMATVFARAVVQGVNIMVASGDSGSDECETGSATADWPADNPNVVAVGGTSFHYQNSNLMETAWSESGGGVSQLFPLPAYQAALGSPYLRRSYPDVSFNADPQTGQPVYVHEGGKAGYVVVGGTSMAAPQWAGFLALVNNARAAKGKAPLGFLNPRIYMLSASQRNAVFNDVTVGTNGAFSAGLGWDAVTGLGSMRAASLLPVLAN